MKGTMLIFATLGLLLCWMLPVDSMAISLYFPLRDANEDIPLNMVEDSVDDMYLGCNEVMMKMVKDKYFQEEKYMIQSKEDWEQTQACAEAKFEKREDKALTIDHMRAICVYTGPSVYTNFNQAVRKQRSNYRSSFKFHSLHYLLTSAIQILNNNDYCHTTYRRTRLHFTGEVNQIIRFGSFTSSSYKTDLVDFGNETCFKIKTCLGAPLKNYSAFEAEEEVLIPPYETFNITEIIHQGQSKIQALVDCKVVFVLVSAGGKSNLNCNVCHFDWK